MHRTIFAVLLAYAAGTAVAQLAVPARPDPTDPKASAPAPPYESAFKNYQPYVDPDIARWRDVNQEMGRLNGHLGHVRGSAQPRGASGAAKPPAGAGHGGHK